MPHRSATCLLLLLQVCAWSAPVAVTLDQSGGMKRGGTPYFVKGAGGDRHLDLLAERGANSIRTWSTDGLTEILDRANALGLTVSAGIWLEPECAWFSYANPDHCAKQADRVKKQVVQYASHPALLAWGLGNEVEGEGTNIEFWRQIDRLAQMVKDLDPSHPTYTAVAGLSKVKAAALNEHVPHLDYVGINTYGGLFGLRKHLKEMDWKRPWMITEWGPQGFWERPKNSSGAPLEQTSTQKAEMMKRGYEEVIKNDGGCLGSYAFVWGWKFEATATWFGLLTEDGNTTESVDVLEKQWSGRDPANHAPSVKALEGAPKQPIHPGEKFEVHLGAIDPDGDSLTWSWTVLPEKPVQGPNGRPTTPKPIQGTVSAATNDGATITAPQKAGAYRVYGKVIDGKGHAATANAPFTVF